MLANDYIRRALARSAASRPDLLVTASGELLDQLNQIVDTLFTDAAQANVPYFHGEQVVPLDVLLTPTAWAWPSQAIRVYGVVAGSDIVGLDAGWAAGDDVSVVPWNDPWFASESPAVLESGKTFVPTGQAGHPTGGSLLLKFARRSTAMVGLASSIDAAWPAEHDQLIVELLATWLAEKDSRLEDASTFRQAAATEFARYAACVGIPVPSAASRQPRASGRKTQTE